MRNRRLTRDATCPIFHGMTLATYLETEATRGGRTVADLAATLGVAPSTIYRWINGEASPSIAHVATLARETLGKVTLEDWLVKREGA